MHLKAFCVIDNYHKFDMDKLQEKNWQLVLKYLVCKQKKDDNYNIDNIDPVDDEGRVVFLLEYVL